MAPDMVRLNCRASPDINDLIVKIAEGSTGGINGDSIPIAQIRDGDGKDHAGEACHGGWETWCWRLCNWYHVPCGRHPLDGTLLARDF